MAKAGTITIAEVEQLVEPGELDPDHIHVREYMCTGFSREVIMKKELKEKQ